MDCNSIRFSRHAIERMFQRSIRPDDVSACIRSGEAIANYPDDSPYPSVLLPAFVGDLPIHVLVAREEEGADCYVVTVYRPGSGIVGQRFQDEEIVHEVCPMQKR